MYKKKGRFLIFLFIGTLLVFLASISVLFSKTYQTEKQKLVSKIISGMNLPANIYNTGLYTESQIDSILSKNVPGRIVYWEITTTTGDKALMAGNQKLNKTEAQNFILLLEGERRANIYFPVTTSEVFRSMSLTIVLVLTLLILLGITLFVMHSSYRQLKMLDKIKNNFFHNITHELKTPLAGILAATELLKDFGLINDPQKRETLLDRIKTEANRLDTMTANIIELAEVTRQSGVVEKDVFDLKKVVENNVQRYMPLFSEKQAVIHHVPPTEPIVMVGNAHQVDNVFSIFFDNALKYGGKNFNIRYTLKQTKVTISIHDDGPGIPKKYQSMLFEKFFRAPETSKSIKGSGLGLHYAKEIVKLHGGNIEYVAEQNSACFQLEFPITKSE